MYYKINMKLKNGVKLYAELPAELVEQLGVEHPLAMGDVNGDGQVDEKDAMAIMDHLAGTAKLDEDALRRADVNGDGEVSYLDAMKITDDMQGNVDGK